MACFGMPEWLLDGFLADTLRRLTSIDHWMCHWTDDSICQWIWFGAIREHVGNCRQNTVGTCSTHRQPNGTRTCSEKIPSGIARPMSVMALDEASTFNVGTVSTCLFACFSPRNGQDLKPPKSHHSHYSDTLQHSCFPFTHISMATVNSRKVIKAGSFRFLRLAPRVVVSA